MKHIQILLSNLALLVLFLITASTTFAQTTDNYIDHGPICKTWNNKYQLDHIEYTPDYTIFRLRIALDQAGMQEKLIQPIKSNYAWYLLKQNGDFYRPKGIYNIRLDGELLVKELENKPLKMREWSDESKAWQFLTLDVYFKRLSPRLEQVTLVEGARRQFNQDFHSYNNIQLHNRALGTPKHEEKRIAVFTQNVLNDTHLKVIKPAEVPLPPMYDVEATLEAHRKAGDLVIEHPIYTLKEMQGSLELEKIVHTKEETIFFMKMTYSARDRYTNIILYPRNHNYAWYTTAKGKGAYPLKSVKNIRKNGELKLRALFGEKFRLYCVEGQGNSFTCQVHFARLPTSLESVNLIEGKEMETNPDHFNVFDIKLWESKAN